MGESLPAGWSRMSSPQSRPTSPCGLGIQTAERWVQSLASPSGQPGWESQVQNTCHLLGVQTAVGQGLKAARDEGEGREDALGL